MADDPRSTSGKITTILSVVDLALADTPEAPQQHDIVEFVVERLKARLTQLKIRIGDDIKRERSKTPPPLRKTSRPMLPPPPPFPAEAAWSSEPTARTRTPGLGALARADTKQHNALQLLEDARAADAEVRDTPIVPDPRREPE